MRFLTRTKHKWQKRRVRREQAGSSTHGRFLVPLGAGLAKIRNGKTVMTPSHSRDRFKTLILRGCVPIVNRLSLRIAKNPRLARATEADREKMGAAYRHSSSKSSDGIVPSRRTSITPHASVTWPTIHRTWLPGPLKVSAQQPPSQVCTISAYTAATPAIISFLSAVSRNVTLHKSNCIISLGYMATKSTRGYARRDNRETRKRWCDITRLLAPM